MFRVANKNHDIVYSALVFLFAYIILAVIIMRPVAAYDAFWHLQMGKDLMEQGLSPWVDHYSVRYLGKDIYPVPVMFQVLLYQFVSFFGEQEGFYYIKLFYITLMMLALWVYFRKIKANAYIVFILLPLVVSAISLRILIRPEIFSFVLVVICLMLYLNAQKRFAAKEMLAICLLLLFWTSYHSPILGYIIIFGLFLEKAINKVMHKDESFSWSQWLLWGVLIFSIGFINLNFNGHSIVGQHFIISMINILSDGFGEYIQEYNNTYLTHSTNVLTHVSWILSIYVAVWSLMKKQYGFVFIVALLTFLSWSTVRLLAVVLLINMCVLALYWSQFLNSSHFFNLRASVKNMLLIVSVCISLMTFYFLAVKAQESNKLSDNRSIVLEKRYPVQATDYLKNYKGGGNVLNLLQYGGYLIYKLSPEYKVYFDGRSNILYPIEFVIHNGELWRSEKTVDAVVEQYDISYVLHDNSPERFLLLKRTENLELSFADDNFMLFSRRGKADFPLVSTLLTFPRCWSNAYFQDYLSQGIKREIERSEKLFSDKQNTIKIGLEFIKAYLAAEDKKVFLSALHFEGKHSDGVRRIVLYMAMNNADADTVSDLFTSIGFKSSYDILLYSYYLAKNGEYEDAEKLAYYFFTLDEAGLVMTTHDKFGILGRIFRILKEHDQIQQFEPSYVDELEANLKKVNYPFDRELSFDFMCK
ncbi:MAG: hypothetical protein BMS9Abin31_0066 [Gammaproteobacteria bacterium]|nr:MAG: hypothetical protein BMS9Abin31_0066 [Gammaproteobacteria bacterium]